MINLIDVTVTNETMNKFLNEYSMDDIIHSKYGYRKANKIDNKLRFEHVRNRPTIQRYFKSLIDNIH